MMSDTVVMPCNATASSDVKWTWNTTDGHFHCIYNKGTISDFSAIMAYYSILNASAGDYSLKIDNVHPTYNGFYVCFDNNGSQIVRYHLVAKSTFHNIVGK